MQTLLLSRVFASRGFAVIICCYFLTDEKVIARFNEQKVEVMTLNLPKNALSFIKGLASFFMKVKPDLVHVQYVAPGLLPIIAAKLAGIRNLFATVHQPCPPHGWKAKWFLRLGTFLCNAFFCVAEATERSWFGDSEVFEPDRTRSGRNHFTIYNGVDVGHIAEIATMHESQMLRGSLRLTDTPVVGVVARLRHEKGHMFLLEVIKLVTRGLSEIVLLVVGDGPDKDALVNRAKSLGLESHIRWLGALDPFEVYKLYGVMDVVAVPSVFEGFGLSAAEAMAAGRPVVASDVDGLSEVVENGVTGYLIPPHDKKRFAEGLIELLSDRERAEKMGESGRCRVASKFSNERFSDSMLAAYRCYQRSDIFSDK